MRTMKIMKRMMGLAAAILALSACSESEDLLSAFHSDPNAVRITAEIGKASADGFTRSNPLGATEADQKKFNENDEISVQADGQDAVTYKLVGSEWQPQGGKFLKWESNEMNFTAYYPASFDGNLDNVTLPKEYDEASLAANDFMSYSGKQTNNKGNQLTLTMERKMARVVVEIDGFNDQYTTNATVNSLSICGIKAYKHDNKFYALIKPCEAQNSETFISLDVAEGESKTTTETLTGIPELAPGNSYTYKLKVGKNKISISGITVANWTGGTITGGKAELAKTPYITFTAEGEQTFMMTTTSSENELYEISGLEYSVNNNDVWKEVVENDPVTFGATNGTLRLRGKNSAGTAKDSWNYATITFDKPDVKVTCTGDIRTLLDYESYKTVKTDQALFCCLFENCTAITSAPDLPAETLADKCYREMFANCKNLVKAPALPAKTLAEYCYESMFEGCTSLKKAPELPATKLADCCYRSMFSGCKSLDTAPTLSVEALANNCYSTMFKGCTSLKTAPVLPAKSLTSYCYSNMFSGCTSLENAPALLATVLTKRCYSKMFENCTSLESAPELPATKLAEYCYSEMFKGCKKLSSVTMLAPSDQIKNNSNCCLNWLSDAGTNDGITRKLIVLDEAAYNVLESKAYLPAIWKKDATNTTVEYYTPKP